MKYQKLKQHIDFGDGISILDLLFIHPQLFMLVGVVSAFAYSRNIPFKLTSIIRDEERNKAVGSESVTHVEGRAFDFSILGWSIRDKEDLEDLLTNEFNHVAAISAKTKLPRIIYFHNNGNGPHGHVQIRRNL